MFTVNLNYYLRTDIKNHKEFQDTHFQNGKKMMYQFCKMSKT